MRELTPLQAYEELTRVGKNRTKDPERYKEALREVDCLKLILEQQRTGWMECDISELELKALQDAKDAAGIIDPSGSKEPLSLQDKFKAMHLANMDPRDAKQKPPGPEQKSSQSNVVDLTSEDKGSSGSRPGTETSGSSKDIPFLAAKLQEKKKAIAEAAAPAAVSAGASGGGAASGGAGQSRATAGSRTAARRAPWPRHGPPCTAPRTRRCRMPPTWPRRRAPCWRRPSRGT